MIQFFNFYWNWLISYLLNVSIWEDILLIFICGGTWLMFWRLFNVYR